MIDYRLPILGMRLFIQDKALILQSDQKMFTLNSSVLGGGYQTSYFIINQQVNRGYAGEKPEEDLCGFVRQAGLNPEQGAGMMTAAVVQDVAVECEAGEDMVVCAVVTAGVSNALAVGASPPFGCYQAGTINIVLLIDGNLTQAGMVNAVITATEGKTMALQDLKVKDVFTGEPASGTSTDAIVVAITGKGEKLAYAGTATVLGGMIGRTVRKAVFESVQRYWRNEEKQESLI